MRKIFKNIKIVFPIIFVLFFNWSCEKDDVIKSPSAPGLIEPSNNSVVNRKTIEFSWSSDDLESVRYTLMLSKDSISWHSVAAGKLLFKELSSDVPDTYDSYYVFENEARYFWKVKSEKYNEEEHSIIEEAGASFSETFSFYTGPTNVKNLDVVSGYENVILSWENTENIEYVEITFDPIVNGINQPIKVEKGINEYQIKELENGVLYSFYIKAFNKLNHPSENDTIKALPLDPTQVHDPDFNIYNITRIGDQTWLRENLRTTKWQDGTLMEAFSGRKYYRIGSQSDIYGLYYDIGYAYGEYSEDKNPCPCGYHVPTDQELRELEFFLGMPEDEIDVACNLSSFYRGEELEIGNMLKSTSGWLDYEGADGNGNDLFMFNLLPAGWIDIAEEKGVGKYVALVTATGSGDIYRYRSFSNSSSGIGYCQTSEYHPIRCIKDK